MLLWSGLVVSVLGSRIGSVAYPLLVLAMTDSPAAAGAVGFAATLPYLLLQLPAGLLVDRANRRRLMLACDAGRVVALASLVAALATGRTTLVHVALVAFIEGSLFTVFNLAQSAAVRHVVPPVQLPSALAQNEARERGALFAGSPIGGFLFDLGRAVPFVVDALGYVVSFVAVLLIRKEFQGERTPRRHRVLADLAEGIGWLWRQPFLRATAVLVAGSNFLFAALVLVLIVAAREQGASGTMIGVMLAGAGVGGLLGALAAPVIQKRIPAKTIVIGANWLWTLLLPPMALVSTTPLALGALFAGMAFVGPAWNVVVGAYQLTITPEPLLGRVTSAETLLAYGAIPLGSLAAGLLLDAVGARGTILLLSAWMLLLAVMASFVRGVRSALDLDEAHAAAAVQQLLTPIAGETQMHPNADRPQHC
jgi:predicted MFS family arabinose efflux permease